MLKNIFKRSRKAKIELNDIQAIILRDRPVPYFGTNVLLHIQHVQAGQELLRKIIPYVCAAENWHKATEATVTIAITFEGLRALHVPLESLNSFPESFREGMAKRAHQLHDVGENAPHHWQPPFGSGQVHLAINIIADSELKWRIRLEELENHWKNVHGIKVLAKHDFAAPQEVVNVFGFRDGISNPIVEGSGVSDTTDFGRPIKAGEFILGYPGESGVVGAIPFPDELGRNGSYLVFRKYHSRVSDFNQFIIDNANGHDQQELLAAKMVGRWRSGAPLVLSADKDNAELGRHSHSNNDFSYANDQRGKVVPLSAHSRRMNPRDTRQSVISDVNLHRIIRKSVSYGNPVDPQITIDDGKERGLYFIAISAKAMETVEFLLKQWANDGNFINHGEEKDPLIGLNQGKGRFTVPSDTSFTRYRSIHTFNVMQGGEYCFIPSITALQWLSRLPVN